MGIESFKLEEKNALVTGGGTGIGFGIASAFISSGAHVVISGRREEVLKEACGKLGEKSSYVVNDVSDLPRLPAFVKETESKFGPLDILVNNAGRHLKKPAQQTADDEFMAVIQTNLNSVFALTREVAHGMIERKRGSVLLISSMAAMFGIDRVIAYSAAKTALTGLMHGLVTEYSKYNVRVNAIAPGWIESEMMHKAVNSDPERKAKIFNRIAMEGFGKPEDIGNAAVYLSSEAARYVTGVLLPVDGGANVNF